MNLNNVVTMCVLDRKFTLAEANELLPMLRRISTKHDIAINRALADQRYLMKVGAPQKVITDCDNRVVAELQSWARKVLKLGVKQFQGGWYGFDCGFGYYSWTPNEDTIRYFHGYLERPSARRPIGVMVLK